MAELGAGPKAPPTRVGKNVGAGLSCDHPGMRRVWLCRDGARCRLPRSAPPFPLPAILPLVQSPGGANRWERAIAIPSLERCPQGGVGYPLLSGSLVLEHKNIRKQEAYSIPVKADSVDNTGSSSWRFVSPVHPAHRCSARPNQIAVTSPIHRPRGARPSRANILAFFAFSCR